LVPAPIPNQQRIPRAIGTQNFRTYVRLQTSFLHAKMESRGSIDPIEIQQSHGGLLQVRASIDIFFRL
jgi:hypothetical protein